MDSLTVVKGGRPMAKRISLKTEPSKLIIKKEAAKDHTYIPMNDPSNFHLLKDNRSEDEKFSRVDKFFVNHYFLVGTEWLCEKIFYPSAFGFEELDNLKGEEKNHPYLKMRKELVENGVGLYGDRPVAQIHKPIKRIELKAKPRRIQLNAKD